MITVKIITDSEKVEVCFEKLGSREVRSAERCIFLRNAFAVSGCEFMVTTSAGQSNF